jgi:hypothetical protein
MSQIHENTRVKKSSCKDAQGKPSAVKLNVIGEYHLHVCKALDLVRLKMIYFFGGEKDKIKHHGAIASL